MKKTFNFGKIDYMNKGRKNNLVTVTVELKEREKGYVFTASGEIWNHLHTDIYCGGQCLDEIYKYKKHNPLFAKIYHFWKLYHLNDMHPECEHQAAAGWREKAAEKRTIYHYILKTEVFMQQRRIENKSRFEIAEKGSFQATPEEQKILSLEIGFESHLSNLPEDLAPFYKVDKMEEKSLGWLDEKEHPEGLLKKACPVCGYEYGTSWKYFPIPEEDLNEIKKLMEG